MDNFWVLMQNCSTFSCGQYGYSSWPIWSFYVADVVCDWYGTDPAKHAESVFATLSLFPPHLFITNSKTQQMNLW